MGKRGRKQRTVILLPCGDPTPRYTSVNEALQEALPLLAAAISKADQTEANMGEFKANPDQVDDKSIKKTAVG